LVDAKHGVYWGKYGLPLKPKEDEEKDGDAEVSNKTSR
jgi:hypothetical protein